jgi:hypothetical protein
MIMWCLLKATAQFRRSSGRTRTDGRKIIKWRNRRKSLETPVSLPILPSLCHNIRDLTRSFIILPIYTAGTTVKETCKCRGSAFGYDSNPNTQSSISMFTRANYLLITTSTPVRTIFNKVHGKIQVYLCY